MKPMQPMLATVISGMERSVPERGQLNVGPTYCTHSGVLGRVWVNLRKLEKSPFMVRSAFRTPPVVISRARHKFVIPKMGFIFPYKL